MTAPATTPLLVRVLGALLHAERVARGLTQTELARDAGLHPMALSKLERGVQGDVGVQTLARLAEALSRRGCGAALEASDLLATAERWRCALPATTTAGGATLAAQLSLLGAATRSASG